MPRQPRSFKLYYDHLLLEGKYRVYDERHMKVQEISIGHNDILVLDRIISFEETMHEPRGNKERTAEKWR